MTLVALAVVAYLIGSIPFAVIVSRLFDLPDPRSYGSGNPGATNVLRTGKKAAAALTLAGDAAKGTLAVLAARYFVPGESAELAVAVAAVAVSLGHMYPVFLRFHGGKGVATAVGVLLGSICTSPPARSPRGSSSSFFFRISSLAALVAAAFVPFFSLLSLRHERACARAARSRSRSSRCSSSGGTGPTSAIFWPAPRAG